MKNKKLIISAIAIIAVIILIYLVSIPNMQTEMAISGRIEDLSKHTGIVIRNESIVRSDAGEPSTMMDGVLQTHVAEGEYVKRFKNVATMYKNDSEDQSNDVQKKLAKVIDRINQITSSKSVTDALKNDKSKLETKMTDYVREFVRGINDRDGRVAGEVVEKMNIASGKGSDVNSADAALAQELQTLMAEKEQYEKSLSNLKIELFSSSSGIFSAKMDGYEEILTRNSALEMTVSDFDNVYKEEKRPITGCKIIDNYEWYAALEVDKKRSQDFEIGETVYLRFDTINKDFVGSILSISPVKSGKCIICVSSNEYDVDISSLRKGEISLIKNIHSGLRIPAEAIREQDGVTGVYAIKGKTIRFIEAEVLYNDGEYAIVKEDNTLSGGLLLYDEVVVSGRNIYDGKGVR